MPASDEQLTAYIVDKVIKRKGVEINEDTHWCLPASSILLAMIEIFMELQRVAGRRFRQQVQAKTGHPCAHVRHGRKFGKPAKS